LRLAGVAIGLGVVPTGCSSMPEALVPQSALGVLTPRAYAVFTAAAMRLVGPEGAALIADRRVDVGLLADDWLGRTPAVARPLRQGLLLLEFGVLPLFGKVRPFTAIDAAAQDAVLTDCVTSRVDVKGAFFRGIRSLAMLAFYGAPATRALTGFPGTVRRRDGDYCRRHAGVTSAPRDAHAVRQCGPRGLGRSSHCGLSRKAPLGEQMPLPWHASQQLSLSRLTQCDPPGPD
jgi:hypothetical protein